MSARFDSILARTLRIEGLYSCDPLDRGGETCCGISRKANPDWPGWAIIDSLKAGDGWKSDLAANEPLQVQVKAFYFLKYERLQCDVVASDELAASFFDAVVHHGDRRATVFLQRALNGILNASLILDGNFGPKTRAAFVNTGEDGGLIAEAIIDQRGELFLQLIEGDPSQCRFARGWFKRIHQGVSYAG